MQDRCRSSVFSFACFILQGWAGGGDEDQQIAFGHVKFKIPDRHPSRLVNSQMDIHSVCFQGEIWAGVLTLGVVSLETILTARRLNEISQEVSADRKRKPSKN